VTRQRQAVYSQRKDGYEVQWCCHEGGGSGVLWDGRVLCDCEVGCDLMEHGVQ